MGFVESFVAWLILTLVVAIIVYATFGYILGWFYPQEEEDAIRQRKVEGEEDDVSLETETRDNEKIKRQKLIAIFIFAVMAILMASSGVSSYMGTTTNDG